MARRQQWQPVCCQWEAVQVFGAHLRAENALLIPAAAPVATSDGGPSTFALLRFTLPTLGVWIIGPILSLIDTAVVGTKSDIELAALGPGTMVCDYNTYIFTFIAAASTPSLSGLIGFKLPCMPCAHSRRAVTPQFRSLTGTQGAAALASLAFRSIILTQQESATQQRWHSQRTNMQCGQNLNIQAFIKHHLLSTDAHEAGKLFITAICP